MSQSKYILVIDGDADHLTILATLLQHHGYDVLTEADAYSGFATARAEHPAAILLALHFGGSPDGVGLIDRLQADAATAAIPLLVVSSFTDVHRDELAARKVAYVEKGGDVNRVIAALKQLLTRLPNA